MNFVKDEYEFRNATWEEKAEIERAYSKNWQRLQIFDDRLFRYYYEEKGKLNFIVVRKTCNHEICGGVGYIKCSEKEAWVSALFVKKGENVTLMPRLIHTLILQNEFVYMVDLREYTKPIYQTFLRYPVKEMKHYYKLFDWQEYFVADIFQKRINVQTTMMHQVISIETKAQFRENIKEELLRRQHPYKSVDYLIKRYFEFPFSQYQYNLWGIFVDRKGFATFIVMRDQQVGDRKIGRIVDIIGDETKLPEVSGFFEKLGKEKG